jgi:hypothetical protein
MDYFSECRLHVLQNKSDVLLWATFICNGSPLSFCHILLLVLFTVNQDFMTKARCYSCVQSQF